MLVEVEAKSDEVVRRIELQQRIVDDLAAQALARAHFADDPASWIDDWAWTYDPRALDMPHQPFKLSPKQLALVAWLGGLVTNREEGIFEKSREVGASWVVALYALNRFLFVPGFKTTFGAATADNVDQIGDPDSIFEKIRIAMDMLPTWQLPNGWDPIHHDNYMRMVNPETGNTIIGQVGKNMGRGGRSTLFVIDEAAFVDQARSVARAVSANSDTKVWVSTANGMANAFYQKREATRLRDPALVFRLHWRDDPRKDDAWAAKRRAEMEPEDWAAEHEIDYGASVERQLIRAEWIDACQELARRRRHEISNLLPARSGADLGAGKAESCITTVRGPLLFDLSAWRDPDAVDTAASIVGRARELGSTEIRYDATGVGFSQGSIMARMNVDGLKIIGINLGDPVPDFIRLTEGGQSIPASDRFANLKAYGWWVLRERAKASWELLHGKAEHDLADCLLLGIEDTTLVAQLAQPTWSKNLRGKRQVDKAPDGAKSPDRADALVFAYIPAIGRAPLVW